MADLPDELRNPHPRGDLTGSTVGRFLIQKRLGAGGMGEVYRAQDTKLHRLVAVKRMAPQKQWREADHQRFLKEGQRASALNHPNIAGIYDVIDENDEVLLVMEYIEGRTLRQRLDEPISIEQFLAMAIQCSEALAAAHEKGILHGDIKPENIMLAAKEQVKLLDFGVARRVPGTSDNTVTQLESTNPSVAGTPTYMPPEVLLGAMPDFRADVFALGVVFHEMLGGRHPFRGITLTATADRILHEEAAPLNKLDRRVPESLAKVVSQALHKDPSHRYPTAKELAADLVAVERGSTPALAYRPRKRWWRSRWIGALAGLSLLILVAGIAIRDKASFVLARHSPTVIAPAASAPKNLAVLPPSVAGDDPKLKAFGDGLVAAVTAKLAQLSENHPIQVVTAGQVHDKHVTTAQQALQEFGANMVLGLTLERSGDMLRATYSLIDAKTGRTLGGDMVTAPNADPFSIEDKVSDGAIRALQIQLRPDERMTFASHGTQQPAAYDYYLQGRGYLSDPSRPENSSNALAVFEEALRLDPNYGLAMAGRGEAKWWKYDQTKDRKWVDAAQQDCNAAIGLGNSGAEGHLCLGTLANGTGNYEQAVTQFQKAEELDPSDDEAFIGLALAYTKLNQLDEAEKTYQKVISDRPQYRRGYNKLGEFYLQQAEYEKAAQMYTKAVALAPDNYWDYSNLGAAYLYMGKYSDAIAMFEQSLKIRPSVNAYSNLGTAYFQVRRFADAAREYKEATNIDGSNYDWWGNLASAYYFSGQRKDAIPAYRKQLELGLMKLQVNPRDAGLQGDLASCYAILGNKTNALEHLKRSLELGRGNKDLLFNAAVVYNDLGETGDALEWLRKALLAGYSPDVVRDAPDFDNLRSNPQFQQLLHQSSVKMNAQR